MISPLWASVCSSGPSGQAELGRAFQLWYPFWLKILKKNVHWAPPTCQTPSRLWGTMGSCHYGAYILAPMYCEFLRAYEEYTLYYSSSPWFCENIYGSFNQVNLIKCRMLLVNFLQENLPNDWHSKYVNLGFYKPRASRSGLPCLTGEFYHLCSSAESVETQQQLCQSPSTRMPKQGLPFWSSDS